MSFWIFCISSLVSADATRKNTLATRSRAREEYSSGSMVFSKVGTSFRDVILAIASFWSFMPFSNAGM